MLQLLHIHILLHILHILFLTIGIPYLHISVSLLKLCAFWGQRGNILILVDSPAIKGVSTYEYLIKCPQWVSMDHWRDWDQDSALP